ncbi:hypothetical protein JWG45_17240 [Leptospira sp. 201903070]|uniref:DUF304 domain-containing protein n=1 Tax=Leptospira ainlahdjerensis TaxID=2810033 RepID=A0ABS2UG10_9LEPT|nr:hypothetical protein [Leptospira ainlahdjerensis]MBM9578893.1 hypothetical protein [Leptospira ainlahdjerensis]
MLLKFIKDLFFDKWNPFVLTVNAMSVISLIISHKEITSWPLERTLFFIIVLTLVNLLYRLILITYKFYRLSNEEGISVERLIQGEGIFKGNRLIQIQNPLSFSVDQIVTLFCRSSGAIQPISLLKIVDTNASFALCIALGDSEMKKIEKYFEEESRKKALFVSSKVTEKYLSEGAGNV